MKKVVAPVTPIVSQVITTDFPALSKTFFCRPSDLVGPDLVGCQLVKRKADTSLLWGVVVEIEAYSLDGIHAAMGG